MIQDIYPHRLNNAFEPDAHPGPDSPVFHFVKDELISAPGLRLPTAADYGPQALLRFLFRLDGTAFYYQAGPEEAPPEGFSGVALRGLREERPEPDPLIFAAYTALHLHKWYGDTRFCGRCGAPTVPSAEERAMDCPRCGRRFYPRINPAVIVGVTNGDRLLLTRYAGRSVTWHALVAGFVEIGETLEETVAREVMEETGLSVKNIRYYKSQPWGIAADILSGFWCDVDGPDEIRMDKSELKEALWVPRDEITGQPNNYSLTNEMMLRFRDGLETRA